MFPRYSLHSSHSLPPSLPPIVSITDPLLLCCALMGFHITFPLNKGACMLSHFSHVQFFATPWTVACQAPLPMGFSRQECWSGLPCLLPGDLPDPGIEPASLMSPALAGGFFTISATWEAPLRLALDPNSSKRVLLFQIKACVCVACVY